MIPPGSPCSGTRPRAAIGGFLRSTQGAAAAELALVVSILVIPLLNVVDVAVYSFRKIQVELAAEAGAQAVRGYCSPLQVPVTANCAGVLDQITTAVQSTSLGTQVALQSPTPVEGYYCVDSNNTLQLVGSLGQIGSPPVKPSTFNCTTYGSNAAPGDYVQVAVTYAYTPVFPSVTVAGLLPSSVVRTAWYRVG